jgi:N-acyl-D-amino-acid deacylase
LGLDYQPSAHADLRELVTLCKLAASYGAIYAAHIRYRILGRKKAWEETFELAKQSGIPVHISHERVDDESAALLEQVDREGIDLTFESYLYPAGMTHLALMLPAEFQAGSLTEVLANMERSEVREKCLPHIREQLGRGDQIVGYTRSGRFIGMTLSEAAESVSKSREDWSSKREVSQRSWRIWRGRRSGKNACPISENSWDGAIRLSVIPGPVDSSA